jgi:hypothetical protein
MRDTREILRQKWLLRRSHRAIAESLGVSAGGFMPFSTAVKDDHY